MLFIKAHVHKPFIVVAILAATGCGGQHPVATVSGKVTVAGKNPLPGGNISFYLVSDPKIFGTASIKSDGTFETHIAPVGECKVVIDNSFMDLDKIPKGVYMGPPRAKGAPGSTGESAATKEKMKNSGPPKGVELDPAMTASLDTGTKKYVKIADTYSKVETTPLKQTVGSGTNADITFDVK